MGRIARKYWRTPYYWEFAPGGVEDMELSWRFSDEDVALVRAVVEAQSANEFVRSRIRRNVEQPPATATLDSFWDEMANCILTTQQRSGPDAPINRLAKIQPYPLCYAYFHEAPNKPLFASEVLTQFGGIRFVNRIPDQLARNFAALEAGLWARTLPVIDSLIADRTANRGRRIAAERSAANFLDDEFVGLGPKQARNVLQGLGLTRYEIPIDSRILRWLNKNCWQWRLSTAALADRAVYEFVLDGVQELCARADILPCIFDAAVFASFDSNPY
jgi:hypothetical protein